MTIKRLKSNARMSQAVIHGSTVYLAGQVGDGNTVAEQTASILKTVDALLAEAGTDKSRIVHTLVWLPDIGTFAEMNSVWEKWVDPGNTPARATVQATLTDPSYLVEIMITAARD